MDPEVQEIAHFIEGSQDPDDKTLVEQLRSNQAALKLDFWQHHHDHMSLYRYPCVNGNVWDLNCGGGFADIWLSRRGYTIHGGTSSFAGVQIARYLASKQIIDVSSRLKFDLISHMLRDPSLKHSFDAIYAPCIFEKIFDTRTAIYTFATLCKPDAYIYISVPQGMHYHVPENKRQFHDAQDMYYQFNKIVKILSIEEDKENHIIRMLGIMPTFDEAPKGAIPKRKNYLINPSCMVQEGYTPPPLGLMHVAAMDPDTVILDAAHNKCDIATELKRNYPKIVGVPVYTQGRHEALRVLKLAKERGAITVAGGPHVSIMHTQMQEAYHFIDHLVIGDGELAWQAITRGEKLPRVIRMPVEDISKTNCPAWHLINFEHYQPWGEGVHRGNDLSKLPRVPIVSGRGCPGNCAFCSTQMINGKHRSYNMDYMNCLLANLWGRGARHLGWQDDCLTADIGATLGLCDILCKYEFSSFGTTRVDRMTESLALRMADVGFYELSFGIESGSPTILQAMGKPSNLEAAYAAREACRKAGIKFTALMIDGYPGETPETRVETQLFLHRLCPDKVCSLGRTIVFPGTRLYSELVAAGKLSDDFWLGDQPFYTVSP